MSNFSETSLSEHFFQCSKTCGIGEQRRTVLCKPVTKEGWILPDQSEAAACDAASRPTDRQACNHGDCSAEYHWKTDSWGEVRTVLVVIAIVVLFQGFWYGAFFKILHFTVSVFWLVMFTVSEHLIHRCILLCQGYEYSAVFYCFMTICTVIYFTVLVFAAVWKGLYLVLFQDYQYKYVFNCFITMIQIFFTVLVFAAVRTG